MKHTVKEVTLNNGAKGLIIHAPGAEVVGFDVEFRAGFDLGDWQKFELPHVIEHAMFTNKTHPKPRQFSREVEKNGAYHNAYTTNNSLGYDYECAEFEAERIAKLIAIQLSQPTFPQAELTTEIANVREELSDYLSNHQTACFFNLASAVYGRPNVRERIAQLGSVTRKDVLDFYKRTHIGGNMRFIVAGDTDFSKLTKALDVRLPKGDRAVLPDVKFKSLTEAVLERKEIEQIYYGVASNYNRRMEYRELVAARVIINLLAHGFSSTLFGLAREKGLIYNLNMSAGTSLYASVWRFSGFVTPANAKALFRLAKTEIAKAQKGQFSNKQFEATKTLMLGERARTYQRVSNLSSYYEDFYEDDTYEKFGTFDQLLTEITKQEAIEAFNMLFAEGEWAISILGNIDQKTAEGLRHLLSPLWSIDK